MKLSRSEIGKFKKTVLNYHANSGRDHLPWRKSINPYKVWVSEIMLQQTQVDRVIPFFIAWVKTFPTVQKLADASQVELLKLWKGLGYNSRALRMKQAAQVIVKSYKGKFPNTSDELQKLPGIGEYTAGAIMAFAYNQPIAFIETNIRRVFIHHFFHDANNISDEAILKLVEQTLDKTNPRAWYWALMDYGSFLGRTLNIKGKKYNPNIQSKHYTKQSKFIGSDRQIRGKVLEILLQEKKSISLLRLHTLLREFSTDTKRIQTILNQMMRENFIILKKEYIGLKK